QLERPAVRLLQRRERQAELHALRRAPLRLAVDRDHRGFAPGALFGPYHFEAALRIVRKQDGAGNLAAFGAVHLAEREVARVVFDRELEVRGVLGERAAASDCQSGSSSGSRCWFFRRRVEQLFAAGGGLGLGGGGATLRSGLRGRGGWR